MTTASYFALSPTSPTHGKLSRRCLTPSCVSPPAVTTYSSRPELNRSHTSPKASTLLSKVALTSPNSRRGSSTVTAPSSPLPERALISQKGNEESYTNGYDENQATERLEKRCYSDEEQVEYWRVLEQRGGYISFPDFERYCQNHDQPDQVDEQDKCQQA